MNWERPSDLGSIPETKQCLERGDLSQDLDRLVELGFLVTNPLFLESGALL